MWNVLACLDCFDVLQGSNVFHFAYVKLMFLKLKKKKRVFSDVMKSLSITCAFFLVTPVSSFQGVVEVNSSGTKSRVSVLKKHN